MARSQGTKDDKTRMASTWQSGGSRGQTPRRLAAGGLLEVTMRERGLAGGTPASASLSPVPVDLAELSGNNRPLVSAMGSSAGFSDGNSFHVPAPGHDRVRYRASEGHLWDVFAENANATAVRLDLKVPAKVLTIKTKVEREMRQSSKTSALSATNRSAASAQELKAVTMVVLLYCAPCNPFHMGDIEALRKAKAAVEQLPRFEVAGVLVVPQSDAALKESGVKDKRRMPFALRLATVRSVISFAEETKWMVVDGCMQAGGSLEAAEGRPAKYLSEYARSRLQDTRWETRMVEVRSEDSLDVPDSMRPIYDFFVGPHGPVPGATLGAKSSVVVGLPKQSLCDELLTSAVAQAPNQGVAVVLERLCGPTAASMISEWAGSMRGRARQK